MTVSTLREFKIALRRKRRRLGGVGGNPKAPQTGQQKLPPVQVKGSQGRVIRRRPSTSVPPRLANQKQLINIEYTQVFMLTLFNYMFQDK